MSRNRFQSLLKFLYFASNDIVGTVPNRLQKMQPIVDILLQRFQDVYTPCSLLVVEETMIPFRGRLLFRQYIPGKSPKYCIKLFKLCTLDAYTWNLRIYVVKSATFENLAPSETAVVQLCQPLLGMGRTLFMLTILLEIDPTVCPTTTTTSTTTTHPSVYLYIC